MRPYVIFFCCDFLVFRLPSALDIVCVCSIVVVAVFLSFRFHYLSQWAHCSCIYFLCHANEKYKYHATLCFTTCHIDMYVCVCIHIYFFIATVYKYICTCIYVFFGYCYCVAFWQYDVFFWWVLFLLLWF